MRVYHILPAKYALEDLCNRRIKIAKLDELNDPFELLSPKLSDREIRKTVLAWKSAAARICGVLCFSLGWGNPLLWSHYGEKHKGICLGFEVPDGFTEGVAYTKRRVVLNSGNSIREEDLTANTLRTLLYTKFKGWSYEHEVRRVVSLKGKRPLNGHYFYSFNKQLQLAEVICGPFCNVRKREIETAIQGYSGNIQILKTILARTRFRVRKSKLGFGATYRKAF